MWDKVFWSTNSLINRLPYLVKVRGPHLASRKEVKASKCIHDLQHTYYACNNLNYLIATIWIISRWWISTSHYQL